MPEHAGSQILTPISLKQTLYLFEVCARRSVESVLSVPTRAIRAFAFSTTFFNPFSSSCMVNSRNKDVEVSVSIGFDMADLEKFLPDYEVGKDTIGKITKEIAENYLGNSLFRSTFGAVNSASPDFAAGTSLIQKTWCIQGVLEALTAPLLLAVICNPKALKQPLR